MSIASLYSQFGNEFASARINGRGYYICIIVSIQILILYTFSDEFQIQILSKSSRLRMIEIG